MVDWYVNDIYGHEGVDKIELPIYKVIPVTKDVIPI